LNEIITSISSSPSRRSRISDSPSWSATTPHGQRPAIICRCPVPSGPSRG